ncbi:hypothetical protein BAUCODRAFT_542926 [Baudoinia panamericana UAMH 10762]|uniref:Uncharacterized protein n=1 Tax=Baudoinia panamericana (strain UAMH 10762) TaxID=717646 RepID=M2MV73_BAUPA|nr:uncharacterized protein BAUCODRAFT_542926 [Baudoinia panamericana UAMH 10762]EMC95478.1 hypothetical protein BAUCODRAFT_542926 [Baudoinia panamericana UAMH 10762]
MLQAHSALLRTPQQPKTIQNPPTGFCHGHQWRNCVFSVLLATVQQNDSEIKLARAVRAAIWPQTCRGQVQQTRNLPHRPRRYHGVMGVWIPLVFGP